MIVSRCFQVRDLATVDFVMKSSGYWREIDRLLQDDDFGAVVPSPTPTTASGVRLAHTAADNGVPSCQIDCTFLPF